MASNLAGITIVVTRPRAQGEITAHYLEAAGAKTIRYPVLDHEAHYNARLVAPGYDVHYLEQEWRNWWVESGLPELGHPAKAFIAFCKARYKRRPNP